MMKNLDVTAFEIHDSEHGHIQVYFADMSFGAGYVTITCYGQAWTAYFGAMSGATIREFVQHTDVGYLVNKLGQTNELKQANIKRYETNLAKIITAVKAALKEPANVAA